MKLKAVFFLVLGFSSAFILSCEKENEEDIVSDFIYCKDSLVSFSQNVQPILTGDCGSCHTGASAQNGVELNHYAGVVDAVNAGLLMDVINHVNGAIPMPDGKPKLNDCKINTIQKWIDEGMLNN